MTLASPARYRMLGRLHCCVRATPAALRSNTVLWVIPSHGGSRQAFTPPTACTLQSRLPYLLEGTLYLAPTHALPAVTAMCYPILHLVLCRYHICFALFWSHRQVRRNVHIEIVPISTGCLGACTYCKTKHARGHLGSYDPAALEERVRAAAADPRVGAVRGARTGSPGR